MPEIKPFEMEPALHTNTSNPSVFLDGQYNYGNSFYSTTYGSVKAFFLNCYTNSKPGSPQYEWFSDEMRIHDRLSSPWLIVVVHCPMYDTFSFHRNETQTNMLRDSFEPLFIQYRINMVFAGHEHAYMRSKNVLFGKLDETAPQYVIIGDGGNREGHGDYFDEPEAWVHTRDNTTFGFGTLEVFNKTHARWNWIKNNGSLGIEVVDDSIVYNQYFL